MPKSTLYDRVRGRVQHGTKPGPTAYLRVEEEDELAKFLIRCAEIGYPHTINQVLGLVQQMLDFKGIKQNVTPGWWRRFSQRHPDIIVRSAVPLSLVMDEKEESKKKAAEEKEQRKILREEKAKARKEKKNKGKQKRRKGM